MSSSAHETKSLLPLPPKKLRRNGKHQLRDETYRKSSRVLVRAMTKVLEVDSLLGSPKDGGTRRDPRSLRDMHVLDIGCGTARLLNGLNEKGYLPKKYVGLDISKDQIEWCQQTLSPLGDFHFHHIDVQNDRYNPDGTSSNQGQIASKHGGADLIVLRSVLTHMKTIETYEMLQEVRRAINPTGRAYITANVSIDGPPWVDAEKGGTYNTLLSVRFNKSYLESMMFELGFRVCVFCDRIENQGVYLLRPV